MKKSDNQFVKACLVLIAIMGSFCMPFLVILIFDYLNIYSDTMLLICSIVATAIPLTLAFIKAFQIRKQVLAEQNKKAAKSKK